MISPIVVCCLRILNCFFRSRLPQENPPSEWRKRSWWAAHKHHGCYVNTRVNMYINPCHPMCTHQAAIRTSIKGGNLQQSQAPPASVLRVSFVFWAVVSASALIIDVSACTRQAVMVRPWEVCRAAGWGHKPAPTRCVGLALPRKATEEQDQAKTCLQRVRPRFTVFILRVSILQQRLCLLIFELISFTILVAISWF